MKPTLDENTLLLVQHLDFKSIQVGDIILYHPPAYAFGGLSLICHRVWRVSSKHSVVLTRGDANAGTDGLYITESMYVGTVVGIVKKPR